VNRTDFGRDSVGREFVVEVRTERIRGPITEGGRTRHHHRLLSHRVDPLAQSLRL
jgi:hypothetical protein